MEMLLLSEERECGKMKKKKIMFIILCMLTVLAAGTAHATEKERGGPTAAGNCRKNTAVSCTGKQ